MKTLLFTLFLSFSGNLLANSACRVYFDELAMLKTVENFEVDHERYELIQLIENNLYRKGYVFSTHEKSANFHLDTYDVVTNGKCAEASVSLSDLYKGKNVSVSARECSKLWLLPNASAISAVKEAIRKIPDCKKWP